MFSISNRRYTGSKLKLADWILESINENCQGSSFFDVFAGTSVIAAKIAPQMKRVILNDTLESNGVIYNAFYATGEYSQERLNQYKERFRSCSETEIREGYFTKNYGGKYFDEIDCKIIESTRNIIESERGNLTHKEYNLLIASLIYSMDRCANTVGHYDAYFQKKPNGRRFEFDLIRPFDFKDTVFEIYQEDANELAPKIDADIAYIDPPYNSRQYCQFYHIYETIVRWDEPELFGKALKPKARHLSEYCRNRAPQSFADLLSKLKCKYFVISYNNTYESKSNSSRNKITFEQIVEILSKYGEVKTLSKKSSIL